MRLNKTLSPLILVSCLFIAAACSSTANQFETSAVTATLVETSPDTLNTPEPAVPGLQLVILPADKTVTPFQPDPITGTPPPSSTPSPAPPATRTPEPTPWSNPTFIGPSVGGYYGVPTPFPLVESGERVNVLLAGSDSRGGRSFRTDTLIIVSIEPRQKNVILISIPRDFYVYIPGWTMNRINTAFLHGELNNYPEGGIGQLKDTILYNLGIPIDFVTLVDFDGFREIVDAVGGVDIPLVCPFTEWQVINPNRSIEDLNNWELITIGPGIEHMDGDTALWYARARMRSSDFDRGRRQQEVIRALYAAAIEQNLILQAPQLYKDFGHLVETDVSLRDIISLAPVALDIGAAQIQSYYINGDLVSGWYTPGGASVLLPDGKAIYKLFQEVFENGASAATELDLPLVEIWNWSPYPTWDLLASERLNYAGYETIIVPPFANDSESTVLYDLTMKAKNKPAEELLAVLGLNKSSLRFDPEAESPASYRLILGEDFDPCFNPADLTQ